MGAALTGAVVLSAAPANAALHETNYTFGASSWGTQVTAQIANLRSDRTAWSLIGCTRMAGIRGQESAAEIDTASTGNPLVDIGVARSTKRTFTDKSHDIRAGVEGTSTVSHITLGSKELNTPVLTIDGLKSTATSWVDNDGVFHADTKVELANIDGMDSLLDLQLLDSTPVSDALQQLKDAVDANSLPDVYKALYDNGDAIVIPGLGEVYLPGANSFQETVVNRRHAQASVKALRILLYGTDGVEGGGDDSEVVIGRAGARISKAPQGIMTGQGYGISAKVANGLIGIGRVAFQPLSCWGTKGKVKTSATAGLNVLNQGLVDTGNILGRAFGNRFQDGSAVARTVGKVGGVSFTDSSGNPIVEITAIKTVARVKQAANGKIADGFPNINGSRVLGVTVNGQDQGTILPGDRIDIPGPDAEHPLATIVFLETVQHGRGISVIGAHVYFPQYTDFNNPFAEAGLAELKLGVAKARIKRY